MKMNRKIQMYGLRLFLPVFALMILSAVCSAFIPVSAAAGDASADASADVSADAGGEDGNDADTESADASVADTQAPVISVTYTDSSGAVLTRTPGIDSARTGADYVYADGAVTASVTVTERSFQSGSDVNAYTDITVSYTDAAYGSSMHAEEASEYAEGNAVSWAQTDTDTWTASFTFSDDGDYGIAVTCTDAAGNGPVIYETHYFTVDTATPVVSVRYYAAESDGIGTDLTAQVGCAESSRFYANQAMEAVVTVTERNFVCEAASFASQMTLTVTAADEAGNEVSVSDYTGDADTLENWMQTDGTYEWTQTFVFEEDANYTIAVSFTDPAGSTASCEAGCFTVDTTPPEGEISLCNDDEAYAWKDFAERIYFAIFRQEAQTLKVSVSDATSGVEKIQYYLYTVSEDSNGTLTGLTRDALDEINDWKTYDSGITIRADAQAFVYVKITDRSGNGTYLNTSQGIIVDGTDPHKAQITITTDAPSQGIYDGDVAFTVSAADPTNDGTYSGISEIYYEIRTDGAVTQKGMLYENTSVSARVQSVARGGTVSASKNNSNDVKIYVRVTDRAGNISETSESLKIDITAPRIEVTYSGGIASNGSCYNEARTAVIRVYERNFDLDGADLQITGTDGAASVSGWTVDSSESSDDAVSTCLITFAADGDYTFTLRVTDKAGNTTSYGQTDSFTIDRTDPQITVIYDNNANRTCDGTEYYQAARTAEITIIEHNFSCSDAAVLVNGTVRAAVWSTNGDIHTAEVIFDTDGEYDLEVSYTDLAGNAAQTERTESFVIDLTEPQVDISGILNGMAYGDENIVPVVTITDTNYDADSCSLTLSGTGDVTFEAAYTARTLTDENGERITVTDFLNAEGDDSVYTLTVCSADLAGNETRKTVKFSVNRYGATFELGEDTADLNGTYVQHAGDVVIIAWDCNEITEDEVTITLDGRETTLTEDEDYIVSSTGSEGSRRYTYRIKSANFADEAAYTVNVHAGDEAGNVMDSANWNNDATAVKFWVDRTNPSVTVNGLDESVYEQRRLTFTIYAADDNAVVSVILRVDGEEIAEEDLVPNDDGSLSYTLYESDSRQTVEVLAEDIAGNRSDTFTAAVMISSGRLQSAAGRLRGNLFRIITLIALLSVILLLILYRYKKKKPA